MRTLAAAAAVATPLHSSSQIQCQFKKTSLNFNSKHTSLSSYNCPSLRFPVLMSKRRSDQNVSGGEDADKVFDELLKKHGKVVYRRGGDQKSPTAEVDDDVESLSFAVALAKVASDVKAGDIRVLFVKPLPFLALNLMLLGIAISGNQFTAGNASASFQFFVERRSRIRDTAEKQFQRVATGDTKPNSWTLLDFGDVVVHIFLPQQRAYYNLEEFYGNATPIELPFDTQSSFRN